jgi:hypothetical protein
VFEERAEVADETDVREREDGRLGVGIDGDDGTGARDPDLKLAPSRPVSPPRSSWRVVASKRASPASGTCLMQTTVRARRRGACSEMAHAAI